MGKVDVAGDAAIGQAVATHAKHGGVDVGEYHLPIGADQLGKLVAQVARATGYIQNLVTGAHT